MEWGGGSLICFESFKGSNIIQHFESFGEQAGAEKSRRSVQSLLANLQYGLNIFQKTCNGNLVIWDQYLSKNMKCNFGNMGSISIKNHEVEIGNIGSISFQNHEMEI